MNSQLGAVKEAHSLIWAEYPYNKGELSIGEKWFTNMKRETDIKTTIKRRENEKKIDKRQPSYTSLKFEYWSTIVQGLVITCLDNINK